MAGFLNTVRDKARSKHPGCFLGVEEPCEAYIPWLDVYHGRAFTETSWPANEPGGISIPLYIYLYHEYQIGYAGWIDPGFSPFGNEDMGLGRAFIFGMHLGVRIMGGDFRSIDEPASPLIHLRDAARLSGKLRDHLILGRMLHDPELTGSPMIPAGTGGRPRANPLPVDWPVVQATTWRSVNNDSICYAIANLSGDPQTVQLEAEAYGMNAANVRLTRIGPDSQKVLAEHTTLPTTLTIELQPWEACAVEQTSVLGKL